MDTVHADDLSVLTNDVVNETDLNLSSEEIDNSLILETIPSSLDEIRECTEEQIIYSFEEEILEFVPECELEVIVEEEDEIVSLEMELSEPATPPCIQESSPAKEYEEVISKTEIIQSETLNESSESNGCDLKSEIVLYENEDKHDIHNSFSPTILPKISQNLELPKKLVPSVVKMKMISPVKIPPIDVPKETVSSPAPVLGKEQIKRRLQSFSLFKQGIQAVPIKKIIKQPKLFTQISTEDQYDENGEKLHEPVVISKPASAKKAPEPFEKARALMNEIEDLRKAQAVNQSEESKYKFGLLAKQLPPDDHSFDHSSDKYSHESSRSRRSKKRKKEDRRKKSSDSEKHKTDKLENEKMPNDWQEVKVKDLDYKIISKVKERDLKIAVDKFGRREKKDKDHKRSESDVPIPKKKEELAKIPVMFEYPSTPRQPFYAVSSASKDKMKYFPQEIVRFTKSHPSLSFCEKPEHASGYYLSRRDVLKQVSMDRARIILSICECKTRQLEPVQTVMSKRSWYPQKDYMVESKVIYDKPAVSYGLSMLTESYDMDEQEGETSDQSGTHTPITGQTPVIKQADDKVDKEENLEIVPEKTFSPIQTVKECKINEEKEDSKTPNTDEYRSNWESDDDIIGILQPTPHKSFSWDNDDKIDDKHKYRDKKSPKPRKSFENDIHDIERKEDKHRKPKPDRYERKKSEENYDKKPERTDRKSYDNRDKFKYETEERYKKKNEDDRFRNRKTDDRQKSEDYKYGRRIEEPRNKIYDKEIIDLDSPRKYERRRDSVEKIKKYDKDIIEIDLSPRKFERRRTESGDKYVKKKREDERRDDRYERKYEDKYDKKHEEDYRRERRKEDRSIVYEESDEFKDRRKREDAEYKERKSRYEEHEERKYENDKKTKHDKSDRNKRSEERRDKFERHVMETDEKPLQKIELELKINETHRSNSEERYIYSRKNRTLSEDKAEKHAEIIQEEYTPELIERKDVIENLDKILKPEVNNSWSTDEENDEKFKKKKELDKKDYRKLCRELKEQLKEQISKKHKKKNKESKKKMKEKQKKTKSKDKYKNIVHIDYNDYEKHLEESVFWENKVVEDIKPRNRIKIDYSDFEHPRQAKMIKEIIPKEEIISIKDLGLPQEVPKEEIIEPEETEEIIKNIEPIDEPTEEINSLPTEEIKNSLPSLPVPVSPVVAPVLPPSQTKTSFLVSEYEEFMKAVCFDSTFTDSSFIDTTFDTTINTTDNKLATAEDSVLLAKEKSDKIQKDIEKVSEETDKIQEKDKSDKIVDKSESSDSSSEQSEDESDSSDSDSESSGSSKNSQPILITNIKQEKLSDAENDVQSRKRKFEDTDVDRVIKKEKIDIFTPENFNLEDITPENIPLPNEPTSTSEAKESLEASPKISITETSPTKKSRAIIPIKLLTAETRKQANETASVLSDETPFGIITMKSVDDKIVSSSDTLSQSSSQKIATLYENLPTIELIPTRKRHSTINLNISPVKKMVLDTPKEGNEESDEDFTERFIKHDNKEKDKKIEPKEIPKVEEKEKLEKEPEPKLQKDDKPKIDEKKDKVKNNEHPDRRPRRNSRERRVSEERRRDRSRERGRKRTPERRREPKTEYSRDREIRGRARRSRERDRRSPRRRSRERDDKYRRRDRRYSRSPTPKKDLRYRSPSPRHVNVPDPYNASLEGQSPVNSPLDGFKRSLADSTISDSELSKRNIRDESAENSPRYNIPSLTSRTDSPASPKRISLDDRINQVLGIEKEPPKQIGTVCTRGQYDTGHQPAYHEYQYHTRAEYEAYGMCQEYPYSQYQYPSQPYHAPQQSRNDNNVKVVQVGNVIQVVPTEQPPLPPIVQPVLQPVLPKVTEMPPKVVQVGNMLQIVPVPHVEESPPIQAPPPSEPPVPVKPVPQPVSAVDQLIAERRAEKEQRRLEREQRRKEKEKKRREKEKRRQLKIKLRTENMIKRALMLETGEGEPEPEETPEAESAEATDLGESRITSLPWPPAPSLGPTIGKTPSKGILVSHGFKSATSEEEKEIRKIVKFADGICPGEGTSPSGGEDLPSPPPPPKKLPKEKRYQKKLKNKNKKKIKVKIIRTQPSLEEEDDSDDDLPPPPPPPGSPPPHLWPPRIKQQPINNIHPHVFPPSTGPAPVFSPQHYPPPAFPGPQSGPPPPPPHRHAHHMPVLPMQGGHLPPSLGQLPPPPPPYRHRHPHLPE